MIKLLVPGLHYADPCELASELVHHRVTASLYHYTYTRACLGGRSSVLRRRDPGPRRGFEGGLDRVEESHSPQSSAASPHRLFLSARGASRHRRRTARMPERSSTSPPRAVVAACIAWGGGRRGSLGDWSKSEVVLDEAMELATVIWGARRRPPPPACRHRCRTIAVERPCATWTPHALPKGWVRTRSPTLPKLLLLDAVCACDAARRRRVVRRRRTALPVPASSITSHHEYAAPSSRCTRTRSARHRARGSTRRWDRTREIRIRSVLSIAPTRRPTGRYSRAVGSPRPSSVVAWVRYARQGAHRGIFGSRLSSGGERLDYY
jgi:hypothetical protein